MNLRVKLLLVGLPAAVLGFLLQANSPLGAAIWPDPPAGPEPSGGTLGALIAMGVLEALAFGAGVAFLVFGWGVVSKAPVPRGLALAAYLGIGWGLVNWVPHTAMHLTNAHDDFARLALIEYVFHATLMAAALSLALFFWRVATAQPQRVPVAEAPKKPLMAAR